MYHCRDAGSAPVSPLRAAIYLPVRRTYSRRSTQRWRRSSPAWAVACGGSTMVMHDERLRQDEVAWCTGRRALLAGIGGIGVAGLLAACGDDGSEAQANADAPPSAAGPSSAAAPAALANTGDVPV